MSEPLFMLLQLLAINNNKTNCSHFRLGSDPEKLFPFDLMLKHLQKCAKYGFIMSTVLLPVLTSESDYGLDFDEIAESVESGKPISNILITDSTFKELNQRLRDIVDDMVRLNYI